MTRPSKYLIALYIFIYILVVLARGYEAPYLTHFLLMFAVSLVIVFLEDKKKSRIWGILLIIISVCLIISDRQLMVQKNNRRWEREIELLSKQKSESAVQDIIIEDSKDEGKGPENEPYE